MKKRIFSKVSGFLGRTESYRHGLIASSLLNIFSKVLGFFGTILTAFFFGSTPATDIFFFSIATIGLISGFLINLDSTTVIPEYMRLRDSGKQESANSLLILVFLLYSLITGMVSVAILVWPTEWIKLFSRFSVAAISPYSGIIRWTGPLLVMSTLNSFLIDVLNSYKRFSLSISSGLFNSGIGILVIFLLHGSVGVQSVVMGSFFGTLMQGTLLLYCVVRLSGCSLRPMKYSIDRRLVRYALLSQGAFLCSMFGNYLPFYLLSGFPSGIISALGFGQRLVDILVFVLMTQFSNVLGIKLNELHIRQDLNRLPEFFIRTGKIALFVTIPVCVVISILGVEVITVLFLRGAFRQKEAVEAAAFAKVLVFLVPFLIVNTMVARLFMAAQKIDKSFAFQSLMGVLSGGICAAGIHFFGAHAYPYSLIVFYTVNLVSARFLLQKWFPWLRGFYGLLLHGAFLLAINALIVPIDLMAKNAVAQWHPILVIAVIGTCHMLVFGAITLLFGINPRIDSAPGKRFKLSE